MTDDSNGLLESELEQKILESLRKAQQTAIDAADTAEQMLENMENLTTGDSDHPLANLSRTYFEQRQNTQRTIAWELQDAIETIESGDYTHDDLAVIANLTEELAEQSESNVPDVLLSA